MKLLAMITCISFVTGLLVYDHRLSKTYTFASWIPTLWLMYCASKPMNYWFGNQSSVEVSIAEGSAIDRQFLILLIFVSIFILLKRGINLPVFIRENKIIILLFAFCLLSIMWSDYPYVSFKRWIKSFGTVIISFVIVTGPSPFDELESIYRRIVFTLIPFSILLIKYYPHLGVSFGRWSGLTSWHGVCMSKNMLGVLCMISLIFTVWHFTKLWKSTLENTINRKYLVAISSIIMIMTLWLMKGPGHSFSATSLVCTIIALLIQFKLIRLNDEGSLNRFVTIGVIVTTLAYIIINVIQINPIALFAEMLGREPDLTGRDIIWERLWPVAMHQPLIGVGFGGYWLEPMRLGPKLTINQAHNGYIDTLIQVGIIGLSILFLFLFTSFKKLISLFEYDKYWSSFAISILLISTIHNYTESSFLMSTLFVWNIIVVNSIALSPAIARIKLTKKVSQIS